MSGIIGIKAQAWLLKKERKGERRRRGEEKGEGEGEERENPDRTSLCLSLCSITLPFLAKKVSTFDSFLNTNLPSAAGFYSV